MRMKARSPAEQTSVIQLACDCLAYLPTERAVQGGGYSARIDDGVIGLVLINEPEADHRFVSRAK